MKDDQVMENHVKVWRKLSEAVTRMRFSVQRPGLPVPEVGRVYMYLDWLLLIVEYGIILLIEMYNQWLFEHVSDKIWLMYWVCFVLTHWDRDKMAASFLTTFSKCIFLTENVIISIKISLKFVHEGSINSIPTLVQIN